MEKLTPWVTVGSLASVNLEGVEAVAADVDHTLFDFDPAHEAAVKAVRSRIDKRLGESLGAVFELMLAGSRLPADRAWDRREEFDAMIRRIAEFQPWADPAHPRKWSRESWMQVINDRDALGMAPSDIARASETYWKTLGSSGGIYPDARTFLRRLKERRIPLVLMTASDSMLKMENGEFVYDAAFARRKKTERLALMDIPHASAVIGDPHDKPSAAFYDQVDEAVYSVGADNVGRAVSVGDSLRGDVEVPAERGYRAYHLDRK